MNSSRRIASLDGVRAFSILLVVAGHWTETHSSGVDSAIAGAFANLGVRIFFVLSGYLITRLLLEERTRTSTVDLRAFYLRRARRILPAALLFMAAVFIIFRHELHWYHALMALAYLTNFDPTHPWFLGHLWSLSVEEQFYSLWPLAFKRLRKPMPLLIGVIAFAPLYRILCHLAGWHGRADETFPAVADILAVGCLLAILEKSNAIPKLKPAWAKTPILWGMLALIVAVPVYTGWLRFHLTALLLFVGWPLLHASIAGLLLHVTRCPYRFLNLGPVVWLGKLSYSIYLWQQLFAFGPHPRSALYLPLALVMACVSYYCVERPMLPRSMKIQPVPGQKRRPQRAELPGKRASA